METPVSSDSYYADQWDAAVDNSEPDHAVSDREARVRAMESLLEVEGWKAQLDKLADKCKRTNVHVMLAGDLMDLLLRSSKALTPDEKSALISRVQNLLDYPTRYSYTKAGVRTKLKAFMAQALLDRCAESIRRLRAAMAIQRWWRRKISDPHTAFGHGCVSRMLAARCRI